MVVEETPSPESVAESQPEGDPSTEAAGTVNAEAAAEVAAAEVAAAEAEAVVAEVVSEAAPDEAIDPLTGEAIDSEAAAEPSTLDDLDLSELDDPASQGASAAIIGDLQREIETLKAQVELREGQYTRLSADFENFRKRTAKEREELEDRVKCDTIRDLLAVVDNFERARSLIKPQTDAELGIHKSYQGIYKQLVDGLKRLGVSPMRPEGQVFDPNLHEAVMREPNDEHPEGTILEELQRGYILGDRVLRHAMVKVAAPGEGVVASEGA